MIPGQLLYPGQVSDPGVNFALVYGLTPVNVHMSFSLPGATSRGRLPVVHVNRTQKLSRPGQG